MGLAPALYEQIVYERRDDVAILECDATDKESVKNVLLALLYAVLDEFHQWFVPGRTAAITDCLIDVSGAAAGQGLLAAWSRARP